MTGATDWECWTLSKEDIDLVAVRAGIDHSMLTPDDYQEIARQFKEGLQWANENWPLIIEDSLLNVLKNKGKAEPAPDAACSIGPGTVPLKRLRGDCPRKQDKKRGERHDI